MKRLALLLLMLAGTGARAQTVEVLRQSGPSANRIDLVILGDGYTAAEQAKLTTDATTLVNALLSFSPYSQLAGLFNVTLIKTVSNQDGADNGTAGGLRDTRYNSYFKCGGIDRLLCVDTLAVTTDVQAYAPQADLTVVVVNDAKYGGSGGSIVVASTNSLSVDILRHEMGHTLGHLADEYTSAYPGYPACPTTTDCSEPNATLRTTRATVKWNPWIDAATPVPTPASSGFSGVGLFEGARYLTTGVYRPVDTACIMDSLGNPFCSVCAEGLTLAMSNYLDWVEAPVPAASSVSVCAESPDAGFAAPHLSATGFTYAYSWSVDGVVSAGLETRSLSPAALGPGSHTVIATVQASTPLVRTDAKNVLQDHQTWTVQVMSCADGGETVDAGPADAGQPDAGTPDAGAAPDAGGSFPDAGSSADAGQGSDAGSPSTPLGPVIGSCGCAQVSAGPAWLSLLLALRLHRRRSSARRGSVGSISSSSAESGEA